LKGARALKNFSTPLLVVAVALIDETGQVLLQRRRSTAMHGGLWEFPGGKLEPGETPEFAALREIEEELGVRLDSVALSPLSFASGELALPEAGVRPLVILLYTCNRWSGALQCLDGEEIDWFAPDELCDLEMPPLDYPLARALAARPTINSL
jgi:8-oxo-dGTP diphosphatase